MIRTIHNNRPTAIITSDIEIRDYGPACRTDDYFAALRRKLRFIRDLQHQYGNIPVLDGGDLFDKRYRSHPSYSLLPFAQENLPDPFVTIPGNHDLPQHEIANYPRCAMAVLEAFRRIQVARPDAPIELNSVYDENWLRVWGFPYRLPREVPKVSSGGKWFNVALVHAMVFQGKEPYPGANVEGSQARTIIRLFKGFDLIVVGHNHQSFVEMHEGRILVNPGSLMRADANQIDYNPRVFLWYAEERRLDPIFVPIEKGVVSREHIERKQENDRRLDAFVSALSQGSGVDGKQHVSFKDNLEQAITSKEVTKGVREKVVQYYES